VLRTWSGAHCCYAQAGAKAGLDAIPAVELGCVPKTILEVIKLRQRPTDEIVGATASAREVFGELGERPVLVKVQAAGLALMVGEQGAVDVEQPLLHRAGGQRLGDGSFCQGQDLDILQDPAEFTADPRGRRPELLALHQAKLGRRLLGAELRGRTLLDPGRALGHGQALAGGDQGCRDGADRHHRTADGDRRGEACDEGRA
jgi:hypothetical protein